MTKDLQLAFIKPTAAGPGQSARFQAVRPVRHGVLRLAAAHRAPCADDICLVRSMHTDAFNHHPGQLLLIQRLARSSGRPTHGRLGRPTGSGSESQNLPGFVVLQFRRAAPAAARRTGLSGFLPSTYQGVAVPQPAATRSCICRIRTASRRETQRARLDALRDLNEEHHDETGDLEIASRIAVLRARLPHADRRRRSCSTSPRSRQHILDMYGVDGEPTRAFATNCLLARRMVERGVRFVMLDARQLGPSHQTSTRTCKKNCDITDQPDRRADQGPQAARPARLDAGRLGRRVRPHADGRDPPPRGRRQRRPRPPSRRLQHVAGRRRHQRRPGHRQDRRPRLQHHRRQGPRPRPAGHHPALPGLRPHASSPTATWAATSASPTSPAKSSRRCWRRGLFYFVGSMFRIAAIRQPPPTRCMTKVATIRRSACAPVAAIT